MKKTIITVVSILVLLSLGGAGLGFGIAKIAENLRLAAAFRYSEANCGQYMQEKDFFHDQACEYISDTEPTGGDNVILRLKVRHGLVKTASIRYTFQYNGTNPTYHNADMVFEKVDVTGRYDYWKGTIPANEAPYQYQFYITNNIDAVYYNRDGISTEASLSTAGDWSIRPGFTTPGWSQGTLWYSVMPESFYNDNTLNDKTGVNGEGNLDFETVWGGHNASLGEWFGGDLSGITYKADYLANSMKAASVFLNPIWVTNHNAGYGCYDFYQIDSALGNDAELLRLVSALHADELKIMLDAVFEYCNVNNILYNITKKYPDLVGDSFESFVQRDEAGNVRTSVWSGGLIDFSHQITRETVYTTDESIMLSYLILFGIDAWRMDVGNTLTGSRKDNWDTATNILRDIRPYLKEVSENILFLSEHADANQLTDGILDSKWNYAFQKAVLSWCQNTSNASILASALSDAVFSSYTRNVSNSLYNFLTTHDTKSFYEEIGYDKVSYLSAYLLMMTYVGSPCIYFGEETGQGATKLTDLGTMTNGFYTSMNWDASSYDYDVYNFIRALATVRHAFEDEYRTGGYMNLYSDYQGNDDDLFAFARFADDVCITILNRNSHAVNRFTLSVEKLNLKDGTVLYDCFSNREYVVKDQCVTVDILPVGGILTTSPAGEEYIGTMNVRSAAGTRARVTSGDSNLYTLTGTGQALEDSLFVYRPGFNNYALHAVTNDMDTDATYACLIRDGDSLTSDAYGVLVTRDALQLLTVSGGVTTLGERVPYTSGSRITVSRDDDNRFVTQIDGAPVASFTRTMQFDYDIDLGFSPVSGRADITFTVEMKPEQLSTDFSGGLGSQFYVFGEADDAGIVGSALRLGGSVERAVALLTQAHAGDFTVRAAVGAPLGHGYAGLTVWQNERDYIVFGRGERGLILAQVIGGQAAVYAEMPTDETDVTLQLEKVGTTYRAVWIRETGNTVVGTLNINYSEIHAGLVNASDAPLTSTYFGFGNGHDSVKDYHYRGAIDFSSEAYLRSTLTLVYVIGRGNTFRYERGYVVQEGTGADTAYALGSTVENFTSAFTFIPGTFSGEDAYIGVGFGASSTAVSDGYTVRIFSDGTVRLVNAAGEVLATGRLRHFTAGEACPLILRVIGKYVYLWDGENHLVLSYAGRTEEGEGYFGYLSHNATYRLGSYNTYKPSGNWSVHNGRFYVTEKAGDTKLELSSDSEVNYVSMRDFGFGDLALGFNLQLNRINTIARGSFVLSIGMDSGSYYLSGLSLKFDDKGRISLFENGQAIFRNRETSIGNISSVYLVITYVDSVLTVRKIDYSGGTYSERQYEEILSYTSTRRFAGTLGFYSQNAGIKLNYLSGVCVDRDTDIKALDLYRNIRLDEPIPRNAEVPNTPASGEYRNDFGSNGSLGTLDRYNGQIYIEDGNLVIDGYSTLNWDAGAAIATGIYRNFELTCRVRVGNAVYGGGFAAIEFYKSSPSINHQGAALSVMVWHSGSVGLFAGKDTLTQSNLTAEKDAEKYVTFTLRVENGVITVTSGTQSFSARIADLANNADLGSGYLSLNAGANIAYFDYVAIKPLP